MTSTQSLITLAFPKRLTVSRLVTSRRRDESRLPRALLCHTGTGQKLSARESGTRLGPGVYMAKVQ